MKLANLYQSAQYIILYCALLFLSTNLHAQWDQIYNHSGFLYALDVVNPDSVFVVGYECAIFTHDGGQTWHDINYDCQSLIFNDVNFPTPGTGYIVGIDGVIIKTTDYGSSWTDISPDTITEFIEAEFISADTGWIIGAFSELGDIVKRTFDGGNTWHDLSFGFTPLYDIEMVSANVGYIVHWDGLFKTINGGNDWVLLETPFGDRPHCCSFINSDTGFVGANGLYRTFAGGNDWEACVEGIGWHSSKSKLQFQTIDTGYYVGWEGMVGNGTLKTSSSACSHWESEDGNYYDLDMFDNQYGYCIKYTGEVFKTTNGGMLVHISELEAEDLIIYPNPFNDFLIFRWPDQSLTSHEQLNFRLIDFQGNVIIEYGIDKDNSTINTDNIPSGTYMFFLEDGNHVIQSGSIIKTKKH